MRSYKKAFLGSLKLLVVVIFFVAGSNNNIYAQSMGISSGAITADASSILELRATNKGLLMPRMTQIQRDAINSGTFATGLIIYNTDTKFFNYYDGTAWQILSSGSSVVNSITGTTDKITIGGTATDPTVTIASTYLGQTSITTLGTISSGTWNGSLIAGTYGGTGVNNGAKTITLGGNFITSGAFATTLTSTATTNVTLPTTGTLATLAGTETFTNKTISGLSNTITNVGVSSLTGTLGVANGGTGATTLSGILKGNGTSAFTAATSGTDYSAGTSALATGIVKSTTTTGALSIAIVADFPTLNQNTTGSAATLTTSRNIYGNAFNGSVDLSGIIASTYGGTGNGFTKFSGPATSEKTFTLPNASANILTDNTAVTVAQGGTGVGTLASNGVLYGNGTGAIQALPVNSSATVQYLSQVSSGAPTWVTPTNGTVTSVSGTTNRITVATGTTTPVIDISSSYVGQSSITTLGTIGTGVWNGTALTSTYLPSATVYNNQANTYTAGMKQIFQSSATTAGSNFGGVSSDPSSPSNGDVWHNTTINALKYRSNGTTRTIANLDEAQVFTNKDLSSGTNTFPIFNQNTTGTASKATNLVGGNATTLLGAIHYQSNTDVTSLLSPNTTTTKKFLTQTGDGTNGAAPAWGTIAAGDVPTLNQNTTGSAGTLTTSRLIHGGSFNGSADVTNIIASTYGGTGNGFTKFSGPATSEKTFTLPNASATVLTDNTAVTVAQGGTGNTSYTVGDINYASASTTLSKLSDVATGNVLLSGGVATAPSYGKVGLTTHVSGVLPIANGGTNSSTSLNNNRIMVSSGGAITEASALTDGQLLIGSSGAAPTAANLTAGNGVTITNAAGSITVAVNPTVTQATATTDATTTSTSDVLLTGMTVTPGAGDYIVTFSGSYENTNANKQGPVSIYVNGTQVAASVVQMLGPGNQASPTFTQAYVTSVGAGQAIEVRWKVVANTGTFHQRTLIVQKVR